MFKLFPSNIDTRTKYSLLILCLFQAFLSFKPSEPYLSVYLICNKVTQQQNCQSASSETCISMKQCVWNDYSSCSLKECDTIPSDQCITSEGIDINDDDYDSYSYDYCTKGNDGMCRDTYCQTNLSKDDVNNNVYPWSTFAYLPFLLAIGTCIHMYINIC